MAKPTHFYGIHAIESLLHYRPTDALSLFVQQGRDSDVAVQIIITLAEAMGVGVQWTHKDKLSQLCGSPQHQGVVLHARPPSFADESVLDSIAKQDECLILILDQITDAHNLGACLRTAVAMGVDAVVCPRHHSASLTPTVAKVSVGAMEMIPVVSVTNLARSLKQLKQAGAFVFGTALDDTACPVEQCDLTGKVAVVMGSEGDGIRRLTSECCDELMYIAMPVANFQQHKHLSAHQLQSLNVSVATGMVLYEVVRQRRCQKKVEM